MIYQVWRNFVLVVILNQSRKKSFRKSKRCVSSILPSISIRLNIGDIPKRVLWKMIEDLRGQASRATCIKIFIQSNGSYHGWKCLEIGKHASNLDEFVYSGSTLDVELEEYGWLPKPPSLKPSRKKLNKSIT